jgi:hypothetical protein
MASGDQLRPALDNVRNYRDYGKDRALPGGTDCQR